MLFIKYLNSFILMYSAKQFSNIIMTIKKVNFITKNSQKMVFFYTIMISAKCIKKNVSRSFSILTDLHELKVIEEKYTHVKTNQLPHCAMYSTTVSTRLNSCLRSNK